ncbi:MAG: stage V sporulation protein S [Clostridia bacterium]|nr:stage V sporulation protein S [Clostridia bacterium]
MDILKISAKSSPNSIAGAIAGLVKENGRAEMQAIGAGAINQAVKAVAIARGFVAPTGIELVCTPSFTEVMIDDEEKTGIKFSVEPKVQV